PTDEFSLTVDYYNIEIEDRIVLSSNLSGAGIEALLANTEANRARFFLNAINSRTQGVDVVATYSLDLNDWGQVRFNAGFNYSNNDVTDVIDPPSVLSGIGVDQDNLFSTNEFRRFEVGSPETKLNLGATWLMEELSVTARTVRYGETQDPSTNPNRNEVIPSAWVTDLDIAYAVTENVTWSIGANNIFDVYPQATRDSVVDVTTFSRILPYSGFSPFGFSGRFVYGKVSVTF
ncbi:MAG: TonB-dependent receptor, partial [Kordiimonadaceae bacterium]|nr:TonB-dependent receptor [Kordiimonadaceae bacterium]